MVTCLLTHCASFKSVKNSPGYSSPRGLHGFYDRSLASLYQHQLHESIPQPGFYRNSHRENISEPPIEEPLYSPLLSAQRHGMYSRTQIFKFPLRRGRISSFFGRRRFRGKLRIHEGIDIAARVGTPIFAARSGHVMYASNGISGYGNLIVLRHNDRYRTVYAHLSKFYVRRGQFVARGQKIGEVGSTGRSSGPHLHFEVRKGAEPLDPFLFINQRYLVSKASPSNRNRKHF